MDEVKKYSNTEVSSMGQIELESRAFIKAASSLKVIKEHWETEQGHLMEALEKNRRLWTVIASAMKAEVRNNILNLALFVFRRTLDVISEPKPESLNILININMNIAKGLADGRGQQPTAG